MAKEDFLLKKCGTENPFKTPSGYFDSFSDELVRNLPERNFENISPKTVTLWDRVKPLVYLAAMFVGIALMFAVAEDFIGGAQEENQSDNNVASVNIIKTKADVIESSDMEDYCNYLIMESDMDDYSMYQYIETIVE